MTPKLMKKQSPNQLKRSKKGHNSVLFFQYFWCEHRRHSTKKNGHSVLRFKYLGDKVGGTVPKEQAGIPSCFF